MPAFVEKFSENMRAALFRACIDNGQSVRAALRAAEAGELEGLSSEDQAVLASMAYGYAATLVKDERERRGEVAKVRADVAETAHEVAAELASIAKRETQRLARIKPKTPEESRAHSAACTAAGKVMSDALALARDASGKQSGKDSAPAAEQPKAPRSLVARIAAEADTEDGDAHTTPSDSGDNRAAATSETTEHTDNRGARPVRLRAAAPAVVAPADVAV